MQIIETSLTPEIYRQWLSPRDVPPRSPGIHVSDVLRELLVAIGRYEERAEGEMPNETMWDLGFAWEDVLGRVLADRMAGAENEQRLPQMELERDGIYGSPDGVLMNGLARKGMDGTILLHQEEIFIEETKLTWMSSRNSLDSPKLLPYVLQGKTYCAMAGCNVVRIRAFFVNGDYSYTTKGPNPIPREWYVRFNDRELEEWWVGFLRHAEKMRLEGRA